MAQPFLAHAVWPSVAANGCQVSHPGHSAVHTKPGEDVCQSCNESKQELERYRERIVELEIHNEQLQKALLTALQRVDELPEVRDEASELRKLRLAQLECLGAKAICAMQSSRADRNNMKRMEEMAQRCEAAELAAASAKARADKLEQTMLATLVTSKLQADRYGDITPTGAAKVVVIPSLLRPSP